MNLGENIYRLRTEKNMSQGDLADALDVSRQSVSKWENNSAVPELEKLIKMSEIFGVTLDELAGKEAAAVPEPVVQTVYVRSTMSGQKIAGILLLCGAFLTLLLMAIFVDALVGLFLAVPLAGCGIVCLVSQKNVGLKCGWAVYLPCWFFGNVIMMLAIGAAAILFRICLLLSGLALSVATWRGMRAGKLKKSAALTVTMVLLLLVTLLGMLPLKEISLDNPFIEESSSAVTPDDPIQSETAAQ